MKQKTYRYTGNLFNSSGRFIAPDWVKKAYREGTLYYENKTLFFDNGRGKITEVKKGDYIGKIETLFTVTVDCNA